MTLLTEELLGARVKSADGKPVGTIEKVFGDNGMPTWAWVRNGKAGRFVPLARGRVTKKGLKIPYDSQEIKNGPDLDAGQHISAAQARRLGRHYGLPVPAQTRPPQRAAPAAPAQRARPSRPAAAARQPGGSRAKRARDESLLRHEEQLQVGKETLESGSVRLHRYVDIEPVEQSVRVMHEEYDIERVPAEGSESAHEFSEAEQVIVLHEEHPVLRKKLVPMERVRLTVREVEEDEAVSGEVRRERIEVERERRARKARSRRAR
jgi:uncharacterized protein (TIGR02271 family)